MKRKIRIRSAAYLFGLASVSLLSCGGSVSSIDSASTVSSEEPSSLASSEELYTSNVTTFFLGHEVTPDQTSIGEYSLPLIAFEGFETYKAFEEWIASILNEDQIEAIAEGLSEIEDHMSSSQDCIFLVWQYVGNAGLGRWYDFYDNTLTHHRAYDCIALDLEVCAFDVVAVGRNLVEDFETVAFAQAIHDICAS